jgi:hypothetical protein
MYSNMYVKRRYSEEGYPDIKKLGIFENKTGKLIVTIPDYYKNPEGIAEGILSALRKAEIKLILDI